MIDHYEKFRQLAIETQEKIKGARAAEAVLELLAGAQPVYVGDVPIQVLVAKNLGIDNPERIAAHHEVNRLLEVGGGVIATASSDLRSRQSNALQMLPRQTETQPPVEQIH